ncbi:MAG: PAS domain-containing protein [Clostridiales bacterium]|nr:PAS domain-containing protein [Clostridiales bacterium]
MKDRPAADAETILNRGISGYHEYTADGLPRLTYVSRNLCDMLGCDAAELSGEGYLHRVHPGDRQTYHELLDKFGEGADTVASGGESDEVSGEYRMLRTDGSELYVRETVGITKGHL